MPDTAVHPCSDVIQYETFATDITLTSAQFARGARSIFVIESGSGAGILCAKTAGGNRAYSGLFGGDYVQPHPAYWEKILASAQFDATQAWQIDDPAGSPVFVDETADLASATATDVTVWPASEAVGDQFAIGFPQRFRQLRLDVGTAGVGGTMAVKFWNGSAWTAVSGLVDSTTGLTVASVNNISWTMPTTWEPRTLSTSASLFYVVLEVATLYSTNPVLDEGHILFTTDLKKVRVGF